ncbi:DUF2157 domain-containing protein [Dyadobacter pollutisoli]|uniref:DUF2157 domain-containing protein n=1 Tax=Dyadobacter pollutisoli TaxID=2910158 RepID=A0A9E8NER7_9BACT|nr:DUF2157 domain-containing protein [Dyadobacter pollutisoli]WAC13642.1 DUF2157 domain-containing protein [Dyadobacter pollutisoli]
MNTQTILNALISKEVLSAPQASVIESYEATKPFSIHWELRSVLYLGIILFTSGIGIIIYENIDTIGHQVIIAAIAALTAACFYYTVKHSLPCSNQEVRNPNKFVDHVLLLGCTLFLALEGYLQFQYNVFGSRYGLAIIIPTIIFFACAYRFDHRGTLSMAITGLASWLGLTIAPLSILSGNDFTAERILTTAVALGIVLVSFGWVSDKKDVKKHFSFTYMFMGGNLASIAAIIGLFSHDLKIVYFLIGIALSCFFVYRARHAQSLVFLLMGVIYGYTIITYSIFTTVGEDAAIALGTFYFLFSSIGVIFFLLNFKKFLGIKK